MKNKKCNSNEEDLKLIQSILEGDYSKFELLMKKYEKFIFYRGLKEFKNQEEAEDFAQDIFLKVFENLSTFRKESKFSYWLFIITKNEIIERKRKLSARATKNLDEKEKNFLKQSVYSFHITPETQFFKKDLADRIKNLINDLPVAYKKSIYYRYFQNLSYKEISDKLNIKINTIKSNVLRGKKIIHQWLLDETESNIQKNS